MSIYKINSNLPLTQKIELLNKMILELNGLIDNANFNKNELDSIYSNINIGLTRQHTRELYLGNDLSTYINWEFVRAENGYSIWKYPVTDFLYDSDNALYMDGAILDNRGEAGSESSLAFSYVFTYNGSTYVDVTTEAGSEGGVPFTSLLASTNYIYTGDTTVFSGTTIELEIRGANVTPTLEYWNGSAWTILAFDDNTNSFNSDGYFKFTPPQDWAQNTVNSQTKYWIRIGTSTNPIQSPTIKSCIPYNSVPAILSMSSSQIFAEEWAWCYYNGNIYVTLRNAGNTTYEGNYFITESSTATNKQNYFIYNHSFYTNYINTETNVRYDRLGLINKANSNGAYQVGDIICDNGVLKICIVAGNPATFQSVTEPTDASISQKGVVQLSNSYTGNSQTLATTEKALKDGLAANAFTAANVDGDNIVYESGNIINTAQNIQTTSTPTFAGMNFTGNVDFAKHQALGLVIENRTSDPTTPVTGQIWFRTDLV